MISKVNKFRTLSELGVHLQSTFANKFILSPVKDIDGNKNGLEEIPAYLFRGEPGLFEHSLTSMERMLVDTNFTRNDKVVLEYITNYVDQYVQEKFELNPLLSAGYIQHYGLYTQLLDFTSDADTAMRFATEQGNAGKPGRMVVLDVSKASQNGYVIDLSAHPFAFRSRRQKAYGVYSNRYNDFKDTGCMESLGLTWYEYDQNDAPDSVRKLDIYDVSEDVFAGVMSLVIDDCIQKHGRIPPLSAGILMDRIKRVPLFGVTKDLHKINKSMLGVKGATAAELGLSNCIWTLASLGQLGCAIDETKERENSYRIWALGKLQPLHSVEYKTDPSVFALRILDLKMFSHWENVLKA
jgi:hypothetical protein